MMEYCSVGVDMDFLERKKLFLLRIRVFEIERTHKNET